MRIWFNNWFNSGFHFINLIKNNNEGRHFEIYGSNKNPYSIFMTVCDYFEVEKVKDEDYINFCINFCIKHKIDVFIPCHKLVNIAENIGKFDEIGTHVLLCNDNTTLSLISDKAAFYDSCGQSIDKDLIPQYHIVNTADDFMRAYLDLSSKGYKVCFKPVVSQGGFGFRIIDDNAENLRSLFVEISHKIPSERAYKILSSQEKFRDLMVMEYLDGYEYSIDCLAYKGELLAAVPRKKLDARVRVLEDSQELIQLAEKITRKYNLSYNFNIQFKYSGNKLKLLEINPRMSGGLHISCLSGVNFPYLGIKLLIDGKADVPSPKFGIAVTQIEKEFELNI